MSSWSSFPLPVQHCESVKKVKLKGLKLGVLVGDVEQAHRMGQLFSLSPVHAEESRFLI